MNLTVSSVGNGPGKFEETVAGIASRKQMIDEHPDLFMKVLTGRDLRAAKSSGRMGFIYGFQDTSPLDGQLDRLAMFQALGVRIVQPCYNRRNLMGDGCLEPADGGLSTLGRELIGRSTSSRSCSTSVTPARARRAKGSLRRKHRWRSRTPVVGRSSMFRAILMIAN